MMCVAHPSMAAFDDSSSPQAPPTPARSWEADAAWHLVLAAAELADDLGDARGPVTFAWGADRRLVEVPAGDEHAVLVWNGGRGWTAQVPHDDPDHSLIELYLPICGATQARPLTVGHLGQSLDGFIATLTGESRYVTGEENIVHLHRMRALCDAVVVGAGTVAADDPLLTARHVAGPSPIRVVLDPSRRLGEHYKVFTDGAVETLYICARSLARPGETRFGLATVVPIDDRDGVMDVKAVMHLLRARGCHRIFVEGGGVTVSMFLEANLLDRLQMAIAPLIIGDGRPAIRLKPRPSLSDCHRPRYRVFRMGGDVLFDCELGPDDADQAGAASLGPAVKRVI
jgi:diaminohydroxyphosphoribosylaminopyrimidine deaminase/5-amino-6-(5-phosphoribosylamino)uracil reductase